MWNILLLTEQINEIDLSPRNTLTLDWDLNESYSENKVRFLIKHKEVFGPYFPNNPRTLSGISICV